MFQNKYAETISMALAGALSVFSFAPFYFFPAMWVSLGLFFIYISRTHSVRHATWRGFMYGLGFYLANVHWIYVSLHTHGEMKMPLALFFVLLFSAYLALFPALATYLSYRFIASTGIRNLIALPILWVAGESLRGSLFTGFPWAQVGYSQLPHTPFAGFTPVLGSYGVSFLFVFSVALVVWGTYFARHHIKQTMVGLCCIGSIGFGLRFVEWTMPSGRPLSISLLQGNIAQSLKWQPHMLLHTLDTYLDLIRRSQGELVILPETAIPIFLQYLPAHYLDAFRSALKGRELIAGVPTLNLLSHQYYNSAVLLTDPVLPTYHKYHLVPFGEYIPLRPLLGPIVDTLSIPLTDFNRGAKSQPPFHIKDQRIAMNICYEDIFGGEIIRALPKATILANISNLAWFEGSIALAQHGQIAQARALETGRPMLRATNTGLTAMIDHQGLFIHQAPLQEKTILTGVIQGRTGLTPYAKIGDKGTAILLGIFTLFGLGWAWYRHQSSANHPVM